MIRQFTLICLLPALVLALHAEVPRKPLPSKYRALWIDSPFTAKPVTASGPVYNPLQDYMLLGVSPVKEGYRVTIMNRKNPADLPLVVETNSNTEGFEIVEILREEGDPMGTRVKMKRGTSEGTVAFEEKFLALKAAPAPKPNPSQRNISRPNPQAQLQGSGQAATGDSRRRIIPPKPPTPGQPNSNQNSNSPNSLRGVRTSSGGSSGR